MSKIVNDYHVYGSENGKNGDKMGRKIVKGLHVAYVHQAKLDCPEACQFQGVDPGDGFYIKPWKEEQGGANESYSGYEEGINLAQSFSDQAEGEGPNQ